MIRVLHEDAADISELVQYANSVFSGESSSEGTPKRKAVSQAIKEVTDAYPDIINKETRGADMRAAKELIDELSDKYNSQADGDDQTDDVADDDSESQNDKQKDGESKNTTFNLNRVIKLVSALCARQHQTAALNYLITGQIIYNGGAKKSENYLKRLDNSRALDAIKAVYDVTGQASNEVPKNILDEDSYFEHYNLLPLGLYFGTFGQDSGVCRFMLGFKLENIPKLSITKLMNQSAYQQAAGDGKLGYERFIWLWEAYATNKAAFDTVYSKAIKFFTSKEVYQNSADRDQFIRFMAYQANHTDEDIVNDIASGNVEKILQDTEDVDTGNQSQFTNIIQQIMQAASEGNGERLQKLLNNKLSEKEKSQFANLIKSLKAIGYLDKVIKNNVIKNNYYK